jgi:hypothetical protein
MRPGARGGRVRTNRKIWPAYEVYGKNKTIEKNHLWMEGLQRRAAQRRREVTTVSPETWKRLTGLD